MVTSLREMRIRVVTPMKGTIDGLDLTLFHTGKVYDVSAALATYLMASGYAMPVTDERPARAIALNDDPQD